MASAIKPVVHSLWLQLSCYCEWTNFHGGVRIIWKHCNIKFPLSSYLGVIVDNYFSFEILFVFFLCLMFVSRESSFQEIFLFHYLDLFIVDNTWWLDQLQLGFLDYFLSQELIFFLCFIYPAIFHSIATEWTIPLIRFIVSVPLSLWYSLLSVKF